DPRFPSEKLALVTDPAAQLIPAPEDRLMCHFRVGLAAFGRRRDKQAVWMVGKLCYQPPFLVGKLGTQRAPPRRLFALAHVGKLQGQDAAEVVLRVRVIGEKGVGAVTQYP